MNFTEVIIKIADEQTLRERLMAALLGMGCDSFMETESQLIAYIESGLFNMSRLRKTLKPFAGSVVVEKTEELPDQNWNAIWESNYEPVLIGTRCIVRAPFHAKPAGIEYDILIQPKMSFGTAHHSTTFLMLNMILESDFSNKRVLDMGSGTGVLAILASKKGAAAVTAIDNDEWAYNNATENCHLNHIKNIDVIFGDASSIPAGGFDVILANINRNILLADMHIYSEHLNEGGIVFLSGFYENDLAMINDEAGKCGWKYVAHKFHNEWVAAVFQASAKNL